MFASHWVKPTYTLKNRNGEQIVIDVTTSVSPGLPANQIFVREVIPFFQQRGVRSVIDFGAGSLRHTFPLLEANFEVCIVEFPENYTHRICKHALAKAQKYSNFCKLVWPKDFTHDDRKFDAALLIYVLQTMPIASERNRVLHYLYRKMNRPSYLFYCARHNQLPTSAMPYRVMDGYYMYPTRHVHSFYREFDTDDTHKMMKDHHLIRVRSFNQGGREQMFMYAKGIV